MTVTSYMLAMLRRAAALVHLLALAGLAGCAAGPAADPTPPSLEPVVAEPSFVPEPVPVPPTAAPARPAEPRPTAVELFYSGRVAADAEVAAEIAARLRRQGLRVEHIDVEASNAPARPRDARPAAVSVAVGRAAALRALDAAPEHPVVVCQVFDYDGLSVAGAALWRVDALPPIGLQLRGWKAADTSLERIGLIVSEAHAQLVPGFVAAAEAIGLDVEVERSGSDRETLYLFKRMAPRIDGLWLLPDNRILSPAVLRELLSYASSHEVGALVFSDALLSWGALLSARSLPADVAASVQGVLERIIANPQGSHDRSASLSAVALDFNTDLARRLGLAMVPDTTWVLREPD